MIVLLCHGSDDPRATRAANSLAASVTSRSGHETKAAFLDHAVPSLRDVVEASTTGIVILPLFISAGFHVRNDVPDAVAALRSGELPVEVCAPLGSGADVLELACDGPTGGPVLFAAAGTSDAQARRDIEASVEMFARRRRIVAQAGYLSGSRTVSDALSTMEDDRTEASVASLLIFPGAFDDRLHEQAGQRWCGSPLALHPGFVDLVMARVAA